MPDLNKAIKFMVDTANDDKHGYDQTHRYGPDYDCSSLIATALKTGGFFTTNKGIWTGNIEKMLRKAGFDDCSEPWKAGDIHLKTGKHVVMSINANEIAHASINEKGTITGGKTGDQTNKEICIRKYYEYKGGWDAHLRYAKNKLKNIDVIVKEVIKGKWGTGTKRKKLLTDAGYDYALVQKMVNEKMIKDKKENQTIAKEVIAGKWGNGAARKNKLIKAGYNYEYIQSIVNTMLGK